MKPPPNVPNRSTSHDTLVTVPTPPFVDLTPPVLNLFHRLSDSLLSQSFRLPFRLSPFSIVPIPLCRSDSLLSQSFRLPLRLSPFSIIPTSFSTLPFLNHSDFISDSPIFNRSDFLSNSPFFNRIDSIRLLRFSIAPTLRFTNGLSLRLLSCRPRTTGTTATTSSSLPTRCEVGLPLFYF